MKRLNLCSNWQIVSLSYGGTGEGEGGACIGYAPVGQPHQIVPLIR